MNIAQALAVAAAALVTSFSGAGAAQNVADSAAAAVNGALDRSGVRAAVEELADLMEGSYVFPDIAAQYAARLRERAEAGAYDALSDPAELAQTLQTDLRTVHADAHLRVTLTRPEGVLPGPRVRTLPGEEAFGEERWLADGVAYVRINLFPDDEASRQRMARILDHYTSARAIIFDLRTCRGGSLEVMDVIFSRLYGAPTELVTMDTRTGANPGLEAEAANTASLHRASAPAGISRFVHWASPTSPASSLADARVYLLTDRTASACEHFTLALKQTGRATVVGATTRGAGHYGGDREFAGGRLQVFLPVGRTYVAATNQGWEGTGVAPDRAVAPQEALNDVLRELGVAPSAANQAVGQTRGAAPQRVEAAPRGGRYGIGLAPPQGGEQSLPVVEVSAGEVAEAAGLRAGDRILSLNGTPVAQISPSDFGRYMRASPLVMVVDRAGQQLTIEMSLGG